MRRALRVMAVVAAGLLLTKITVNSAEALISSAVHKAVTHQKRPWLAPADMAGQQTQIIRYG